MFSIVHALRTVAGAAYNAVRWCVSEFLPVSVRNTVSSRLTDLCRLLGFGTLILILAFETGGFASSGGSPPAWGQWLLDAIVAVLIGNLVKELALVLCVRIVNAMGRNFYRKGIRLNGTPFRETFHPDGSWRRCEYRAEETVCEWTDAFGACNRSIVRLSPEAHAVMEARRGSTR
jgi:type IV secretory pathway VirB2 component (pilin)